MSDSQDRDNLAVLTGFYSALEAGDVETALGFVDKDVVVTYPDSMPMAGEWRGHAGLLDLFGQVCALWQDRVSEVEDFVSSGHRAIVLLTTSGKINGRAVTMPIAEAWSLRNGLLVEGKPFFWDTTLVKNALEGR